MTEQALCSEVYAARRNSGTKPYNFKETVEESNCVVKARHLMVWHRKYPERDYTSEQYEAS